MYTPLLLGAFGAAACVCLALALFFARAWQGRRQRREYLVFALLVLTLAVMTALEALLFSFALTPTSPAQIHSTLTVLTVCARLSPPLLLHFCVLLVRKKDVRLLRAVYGCSFVLALLAAAGLWFSAVGDQLIITQLTDDVSVHTLQMTVSSIAIIGHIPESAMFGYALLLLWRYHRSGQRESFGAVAGATLMFATNLHDIGISLGWFGSPPLMPLGMIGLGFGVSMTLITSYGKLSRALERRTAQLDERAKQLHVAYDELFAAHAELERGEEMAIVGELAAVVAHQVRNPLSVIGNAISSLRKPHLRDEDRSMLASILSEELERLETLVAHLLDYSRPVAPRNEDLDVAALAQRSLAVMDDQANIRSKVSCSAQSPSVEGDPELLLEAFENLASNAAAAMSAGGELNITIKEDNVDGTPALAVCFADNGEGMSDEALEHAHRPFFTTRPTGTGLGLPLVARIVEAHEGVMDLDSAVGKGTRITLLLPRVKRLQQPRKQAKTPQERISVLP